MFFAIEAYKSPLGLWGSYRLKKGNAWGEQEDFKLMDEQSDMIFKTYTDAEMWLLNNPTVLIDSTQVSAKPSTSHKLGESEFRFEIIAHRVTKPKHQFTKEELKNILIGGDDSYNNSLVIDHDGFLHLIKLEDISPLSLRNYAVRTETFGAGNNYVGSSSDLGHLNNTFLICLEGWLLHLKSGRNVYRDCAMGEMSVEKLIDEIKEYPKADFVR